MDFALHNQSPSSPSPITAAISVASPPAPSLSRQQLGQCGRRECEHLHRQQSHSSPASPTPVPLLTTSHTKQLLLCSGKQVCGRPDDPYHHRQQTPSPPAT